MSDVPMIESAATSVEAESTRAKSDDLQKPAGHGDIFEEMDELVLVSQSTMENQCGKDTENREHCGGSASAVAGDQRSTAQNFNSDRDSQRQLREWQPNGADVTDHHGGCANFGYA